MALMIQAHIADSPDYAVLSCFLSGCFIFTFGILNLGVLVRFISVPVTTGFTLAAAVTIASGQINNLFGIKSRSHSCLFRLLIVLWFIFISQVIQMNLCILGQTSLVT